MPPEHSWTSDKALKQAMEKAALETYNTNSYLPELLVNAIV